MFFFFFFFCLLRAALKAYGGSQARGWIRALASYLPKSQPQQRGIHAVSGTYNAACGNAGFFNPLMEARDQTCILTDNSWFLTCWATTETPTLPFNTWNICSKVNFIMLDINNLYLLSFSPGKCFAFVFPYCIFLFFFDFHFDLYYFLSGLVILFLILRWKLRTNLRTLFSNVDA